VAPHPQIKVWGFPPIRQKDGEWMGHGALIDTKAAGFEIFAAASSN
jgi:hypothetical protein